MGGPSSGARGGDVSVEGLSVAGGESMLRTVLHADDDDGDAFPGFEVSVASQVRPPRSPVVYVGQNPGILSA
jgi:hypothetical protein